MVIKIIGAILTVICFAVSMEIPRRFLWYSGAVGGIGWSIYLILNKMSAGVIMATFISAMVITVLSQIGARILKAPVTVFLIAGILPLVPGAGMYRTVYYTLHNDSGLSRYYLRQTFMIAGAIALAIFIIDSLYRVITKQRRHFKEVLIVLQPPTVDINKSEQDIKQKKEN